MLVLMCVGISAQDDCPDPILECAVNPCQDQVCNRFFNADCRPNLCHGGLCTANFFFRGRNVTERCDAETCDEKPCNENRQCMEVVVPPECPPQEPDCRQVINAQCILMEFDRPMTCQDVRCEENTACRLRIRTEDFPPVVRCFPMGRVNSCVEGTCNEGFTCFDDGPSVRCELTFVPTTCEEQECEDGFECMIDTTDGASTPICVPLGSPTPPLVACEPECASGFECIAIVVDGIATSTCVPAVSETCSDLDCGTRGLACEEEPTGPRCVTPSFTCEELEPVCAANSSVCIIEEPFGPRCV